MKEILTYLQSGESETVEFKERWNEAALEALAAFANTRGGTLLAGVDDHGRVVGWSGKESDFRTISNQIVDALRIQPAISQESHDRKRVLLVRVSASPVPVACRGHYYRRVGSTTREIPPEEMGRFFVAKLGIRWDSIAEDASLDEIDAESVRQFVRMARRRLPQATEDEPVGSVLRKLDLVRDGRLTRAAILLFGRNPQRRFLLAEIHMGRFKEPLTIVDDKLLKGNLFQQLDQAIQLFQQYLQVRIQVQSRVEKGKSMVEALRHRETWDYPLDALREAVVNALIHRDYFETSADVQIRVLDDGVRITNPGGLPEDMTVEDLKREHHPSRPRNPLLAQVFYYAELTEKWGSGTWRMADMCRAQGLPEPEFVSTPRQFEVRFSKDPYTEERLRQMGLNERQVKAVARVKQEGSISNTEYQKFCGTSERTATRDLSAMVTLGVLDQTGTTGKGTRYVLRRLKGAKDATKTPGRRQTGRNRTTKRAGGPKEGDDA